ncbi:hypothetical protein P3T35_007387 [Kitasatospora sp. GP30]|nr:hypothetical protein [Kitasatospora sp. GP30]MDH6145332.1 hypothetical protein [Kitasatospora sp. GP30]
MGTAALTGAVTRLRQLDGLAHDVPSVITTHGDDFALPPTKPARDRAT